MQRLLKGLWRFTVNKLTLYINGYIKNLHDSEDLLIEVLHIRSRANGGNIIKAVLSYIYKAARNHALMFLRKAKDISFLQRRK